MATAVALVCFGQTAQAVQTVPYKMNFQGRLTDASGTPKPDGIYNIKFRIYNAASTVVWSEDHLVSATQGVTVTGGLFSVQLGSITPLDPALFNTATANQNGMTLEVELPTPATATSSSPTWTEGAMTPRSPIATSAYSFNSDTLDGVDSTGFVRNQNASQQTATNFWMSGTGRADTALQAPLIDTATATTLSLGTTNAISISLNKDVTVAAGRSLTLAGGAYGTRPGSPGEGALYYDTDTDKLLSYANAKWQADRTDAIYVAASNSSQADKDIADYVTNGDTAAANDGDQIQINDALTAATGKGVVLLAGTYAVDATILVPNNTTIAGVGDDTLIQLADIDVSDNVVQNADTSTGTGVVVRDMKIDGQKSLNTAGTQHGVYFGSMGDGEGVSARKGGVVERVHAVAFSGSGIALSSSNNNVIHASTVMASFGGILLDTSLYNMMSNNSVHDSGFAGIQLQNSSSSNSIADNQVHSAVSAGIRIQSNSAYNTVTGNQISGGVAYGIYSSSIGSTFSNNSVTNSGQSIYLAATSANNSVVANVVRNSTNDGIYMFNSSRNTVSDNSIQNTTDEGLVIDSESHNNTVTGNAVDVTGGSGILIIGVSGDEPTNNTVTGNSIVNTGGSTTNYGIDLIYAHKNTITGNRMTDDSCSGTCYAISIKATASGNYFADNVFNSTPGTAVVSNLGSGTVYSNQPLAEDGAGVTNQAANSTAAFKIQNATGGSLFTVDSTNSRLYVGTVAGDTTGTVLVLGNKTDAGNPTGVDGAMYYNSDSKSFECYKNGLWGDCNFASLRSEWVLQEDFIDAGVATATIGTYEWTLTDTSTATEAKVSAAADASNRDRWGIYQTTTAATAGSGNMLRLDPNGMAGTPSNMTVEFDHGPSNAAAANGTQTVVRIGLMNGTTTSADPTDGIYFQYNTTTTAGNWFMCAQNNNAVTCLDTGVARTTTINTYQRFKFVTNSTGASVEFFINEASVGTVSANLPANIRPIGPAIAMHTVDAVARAWKIDYYQIKRNLTTLR